MVFDTFVDVNAGSNAAENVNRPFGVKVSFRNEIRRASCNGPSYDALCGLVAEMFQVDRASIVLKYQDEDGDKITMSSDGELQEAIGVSKDKNLLRLFVESKVGAPVVEPPVAPQAEPQAEPQAAAEESSCAWGRGMFGLSGGRGGFGPRGGFGGHGGFGPRGGRGGFGPRGGFGLRGGRGGCPFTGPFGHGPMEFPENEEDEVVEVDVEELRGGYLGPMFHRGRGGHGPHGHGPHSPHGHGPHSPHGPHGHGPHGHGPHGHGPHGHGPHGPHGHGLDNPRGHPYSPRGHGPRGGHRGHGYGFHHGFGAHPAFAHGTFAPYDPAAPVEPEQRMRMDDAHAALKERKRAMKETLHEMKANATTKEDKEAIKDYKKQMKAQLKDMWKGFKHCKKNADRLMARHVADVTIPDNSELPPDTAVMKTWRLRNPGEVAWPAQSQLLFVSKHGDNLNGPERVIVEGPVLPQEEVEVSVPFITPTEAGRYVGYYRMATPEGVKFGQRVWVSFVIPATAPANTTVATGSASDIEDITERVSLMDQ